MAFEEVLQNVTLEAGADLTGSQYLGVKLNATGQAVACDTAGEQAYGVLQNDPESGDGATVARDGITKMYAGGAVSIGDEVAVNGSGQAVTAGTGNVILGIARSDAASGEIVSVDFRSYLGTAA